MKTAREMKKIMDSIFKNLSFEMETPEMFTDGHLPTLDFECWKENEKILYSFYQKEVSKKTLIDRKSALGENTKVASLTQNLMRRMKNTSEDVDDSVRIDVVNAFSSQIKASGYSDEQNIKIVKAGLTGYENLLQKCKLGKAKMHRLASEGYESRRRKKLLGKSNWFKKKSQREKYTFPRKPETEKKSKQSEEIETVTVIFVSQTPNGELAKRLQKAENKIAKFTGERVRICERGGKTIREILHKSNPWSGGNCGRRNCLPCVNGDGKQDCFVKNCVYDIICLKCSGDNKEKQGDKYSVYTGETARCQFLRGSEHLSGLLNKQPGNALYKHVTDVHQGEFVDFRMKVVRRHKTCLLRQVHEAVRLHRISRNPGVKILNSRGEYNRCKLVRLQVADESNEFKDPNEQGGGDEKYTFPCKQQKAKPKADRDFRESKDKPKVNDSSSDQANQVNFQSTSNINDFQVTNSNKAALQQTESKPNDVLKRGEVNQQPRRVYKFVANNYRIRKKFERFSDKIDR